VSPEEASRLRWFKRHEFACSCCGAVQFDYAFAKKLDCARELAETPFTISSGYRCKAKNDSIFGASTNSSHMSGKGVDLAVSDGSTRWKIVDALLRVGVNRLGIYETHVHADVDQDKPQEVIWHQ